MTARVASTILPLVCVAGACAVASAEPLASLEATSALRLQPGQAQTTAPVLTPAPVADRKLWDFDLDFIFWYPWDADVDAMTNNVVGAADVQLDDLVDDADNYAPQARFSAWNETGWGVEFSATYHKFNANGATGAQGGIPLQTLIDTDLEWIYFDLSAGFRLLDSPADSTGFGAARVDLLAGVRYADLEIRHTAQSNGDFVESSEDYIEPIAGLRTNVSIRDDVWWMTRFDISGITGTDLTWMLDTGLEWELANRINLLLGYRVQQVDYDEGSGATSFGLNGTFHGPYVGLNLSF